MIQVGIIGSSGYTAIEALKILLRHPEVRVVAATSRQGCGQPIQEMHPQLTGRVDLAVEDLSPQEIGQRCDVAFSCLPHAASAAIVSEILAAGCKVIDLSADYRLSSQSVYEQWYQVSHPDPDRLGQTPYGLPELFEEKIRGADLVANPGCYPTSAILPLAPLIQAGLIETQSIVVDSKSGVSGAGRTPKLGTLFAEVNESFAAYGVGTHRHQPEMMDILERFTAQPVELIFTPHLVPMDRGILSTIYVRPRTGTTLQQAQQCLQDFYQSKPFVRVVPHLPATKYVAHTNYCDISLRASGDWLVLLCALDNLIKGASGAAVQCLNVMFGLDQTAGLG